MERDYGAELDEIRRDLQVIRQQLAQSAADHDDRPDIGAPVGKVYRAPGLAQDKALNQVQRRLETECGQSGDSGRIAYAGVFTNGENQSTWSRESVSADGLLRLAGTPAADRVMRALGGPGANHADSHAEGQPLCVSAGRRLRVWHYRPSLSSPQSAAGC